MKVLLADDDKNVRSALRLLLENEPGVTIVDDCVGTFELVEQVRTTHADVVLVDWGLPYLQASGVVAQLRATHPECQLLALSGRPEQRDEALRAGFVSFVCKGDAPESLLAALRELRH